MEFTKTQDLCLY